MADRVKVELEPNWDPVLGDSGAEKQKEVRQFLLLSCHLVAMATRTSNDTLCLLKGFRVEFCCPVCFGHVHPWEAP
jgi:hypothetical protein